MVNGQLICLVSLQHNSDGFMLFDIIKKLFIKIINSDRFEKSGHNIVSYKLDRNDSKAVFLIRKYDTWSKYMITSHIVIKERPNWNSSPDPRVIKCSFNGKSCYFSGYDIDDKTGDELSDIILKLLPIVKTHK